MPAWLLLVLEEVVPLILEDLAKAGAINEVQKLSVETLVGSEEFLGKLHTYYQFPGDPKPDEKIVNFEVDQPGG